MIEAKNLTKRYGIKTAVDQVNFQIHPGQVTGFLGPNGAGKSTTMRMIVGLDRPTEGSVTIGGLPYTDHRHPMFSVGALLEAKAVHPGRTARSHLRSLAATHKIPARRVDEVLELTGLSDVATQRVKGFSLGMGQRLGLAAALLGDPETLILDEPVNGLDPDGVMWVRNLLRQLASEGRTVLLSSHLMSEMAITADHVIVLGRGQVVADAPIGEFVGGSSPSTVRVSGPTLGDLERALTSAKVTIRRKGDGTLEVQGLSAKQVGAKAFAERVELHELTTVEGSLEDAYMNLTRDDVEYRTDEAYSDAGLSRTAKPAPATEQVAGAQNPEPEPEQVTAGSGSASKEELR